MNSATKSIHRTIGAAALGAGAMYLFDPQHGEKRRQKIMELWSSSVDSIANDFKDAASEIAACAEGRLPARDLLPPEGGFRESAAFRAVSDTALAYLGIKTLSVLKLRGALFSGLGLAMIAPIIRSESETLAQPSRTTAQQRTSARGAVVNKVPLAASENTPGSSDGALGMKA